MNAYESTQECILRFCPPLHIPIQARAPLMCALTVSFFFVRNSGREQAVLVLVSPVASFFGLLCRGTMSDIDAGCGDDDLSSDSNSEFSDFVPANWHGAANAGGPAAANAEEARLGLLSSRFGDESTVRQPALQGVCPRPVCVQRY
ncbi:hypothetical protein BRADI_4g13931v3 [Brachypodium distachyon]|uniref:Uncharacterized protein n=1 Tax=Brachypodium distachyon TaxID=15368 RepID=A0A0Q3L5D2_BRADI|nr:hypothetical protein BRADI_4g13931v3 [Brachypodium distachyon]